VATKNCARHDDIITKKETEKKECKGNGKNPDSSMLNL
jgi:hypothetical protein